LVLTPSMSGHIRREHVHADRADDPGAAAADQYEAVILQPSIQAISVTRGNDS
jgi:hypothetical protein